MLSVVMLNVTYKPLMLGVIMLNVVMLMSWRQPNLTYLHVVFTTIHFLHNL
jgi:hypothetical protein